MKKGKGDKGPVTPLSLNSKRGSLNQEKIVEPYRMEWKVPLQNVQNNNSKVFFQNMKAELSNIKNDFEKLIKKEITLKNDKEDNTKANSINRPKHNASIKKEQRKQVYDKLSQYQRYQPTNKYQEQPEDYFNKFIELQKKLPCTANQYRTNVPKTIQIKDNIIRSAAKKISSEFQPVEIFNPVYIHQTQKPTKTFKEPINQRNQKDQQIQKLNENLNRLRIQLQQTIQQRDFTKSTVEKLFAQKNILLENNSKLGRDYQLKSNHIEEQKSKIQHLNSLLRQSEQKMNIERNFIQQFDKERHFYNEKINELAFHNQNLGGVNMQLSSQNEALKENLGHLQRFVEDMKRRNIDNENDFKRKQQYMQRDLQQYQKRQDMFMKQLQKLNRELAQKSQYSSASTSELIPYPLQKNQQALLEQIAFLKDEIYHLNNQVKIQKEIHSNLSSKYQQHIASLKIQQFSKQFQQKLNNLTQQNYKLRSKINTYESSNQSLTEQLKFYKEQIYQYEEREKHLVMNKNLRVNQWQQMTEQIERLKQENKKLADQLQLKSIQKEVPQQAYVCISPLNTEDNDNLLKMAHHQLLQTKELKQTIKKLSLNLKNEGQKVQNLRLTNQKLKGQLSMCRGDGIQIQGLKKRHEQLFNQLHLSESKLNKMKQLFFKVLVEKVNKKEDQQQMQYYLKEIDSRINFI